MVATASLPVIVETLAADAAALNRVGHDLSVDVDEGDLQVVVADSRASSRGSNNRGLRMTHDISTVAAAADLNREFLRPADDRAAVSIDWREFGYDNFMGAPDVEARRVLERRLQDAFEHRVVTAVGAALSPLATGAGAGAGSLQPFATDDPAELVFVPSEGGPAVEFRSIVTARFYRS